MERVDAVVVGAGVAGLTAAVELQRSGRSVLVVEGGATIGGLVQTQRRDGYLIDCGPTALSQPSLEAVALLEMVGLWRRRQAPLPGAQARWTVRRGRLVRIPRSPRELLMSPVLSPAGKLRLALAPLIRPRQDESDAFAAFIRRRFGRETFDRLGDPMQQGIFAGDPEQLSVTHAFPRLRALETEYGSLAAAAMHHRKRPPGLWTFPDGMAELPLALAAQLASPVRLGAQVTSVRLVGDAWNLQVADGSSFSANQLVLAVAPASLSILEAGAALDGCVAEIAGMPMAPMASVALGYASDAVTHPLDGFGALVPHCEHRGALGVIFSSSTFADRAPGGHVLITVLLGGMRQPRTAGAEIETLRRLAVAEAASMLGIRGPPTISCVTRWPRAIPQPDLQHARRVAAARRLEEQLPGFSIAGSWRCGVGLVGALDSGLRTARRLAGLVAV